MSNVQDRLHQFRHSDSQRRASVVYGSAGKQGLFVPSDFFGNSDEAGNAETTLLIGHDHLERSNRRNSIAYQEVISQERSLLRSKDIDVIDGDDEAVELLFEQAVINDKLNSTSVKFELYALMKASVPLVLTFLLQNSLSTVSVFSVGHLGATELAAVSMGSMTANITGYATIQGIATALDTLCPQAFGAQKYHLVGAYTQKCAALIFTVMIPVLVIWSFFGFQVITLVMSDKQTAQLAADYLRYVSPGIPAYILFECGKRFLQAQGIYQISTYVLLFAAPSNLIMNIVFVKKIGYLGAPIAVAVNYWLMFFGLLAASVFYLNETNTPHNVHPRECWDAINIRKAFLSWRALLALAIPGLIMLESEFLAFEILTLMASYLGTLELAAQSVGSTMASLTYQVPYALGIAASTRIANYLGAGLPIPAKVHTQVALTFGMVVSVFNFLALFLFQNWIARLFTNDERVISLVKHIMWLVAFMQISDAMNANSAGCLRGQGQTKIGGVVNLVSYYVVGIPLSIYLSFYSPWKGSLYGLWIGSTVALTIIGVVQTYFSLAVDFEMLCEEARQRTDDTHSHLP